MPREMIMNAALKPSAFGLVWFPDEPKTGEENVDMMGNGTTMPRVKHGNVKSPVWEGQAAVQVDLPGCLSPKTTPRREYARAYTERCVNE
jgi:hypothetical protein